MKKISLFLLLIITGVNTCGAMIVKNTKINPAMVVAASKLQAKPIVFFDIKDLNSQRDYQTGYLIQSSKSDEMNDIEAEMYKAQKDYSFKSESLGAEQQAIYNKYCANQITQTVYQQEILKINDKSQKISDEINASSSKYETSRIEVKKKIANICATIAKRLGACAFFYYQPGALVGGDLLYACVDPAYDITQEVFDTLNKEYKESKAKKCSHCDVHCPHNH